MPSNEIITCKFDNPLGEMIAGTTGEGICLLEWIDRGGEERIFARLEKRQRLPVTAGGHPHLAELQRQLSAFFERSLTEFDLPLDLKGTPFESQVWNQLLAIPYGETRSYGETAAALGKPGAARAVGRANGANYVSIIVPCHRVIETNGSLRGYGGGLDRKRYLLDLEAGKLELNLS